MSEQSEKPTTQEMVSKQKPSQNDKITGRSAFIVIEVVNWERFTQVIKSLDIYLKNHFDKSVQFEVFDCDVYYEESLENLITPEFPISSKAKKQLVMSSFASFVNIEKEINSLLDEGVSVIAFNYNSSLRAAMNWVFEPAFAKTCFEGFAKPDRVIVVNGVHDELDKLDKFGTHYSWLYKIFKCVEDCIIGEGEDTDSPLFAKTLMHTMRSFDNNFVTHIPETSTEDYMLQTVNQIVECAIMVAQNMPQDVYPRLVYECNVPDKKK